MTVFTPEAIKALNDPSLFIGKGFIGGEWTVPSSGKEFPVYEPSSGTVLGMVSDFGLADFKRAVADAETGFQKYSTSTTAAQRGQLLRNWFNLIMANADDIATILTLENGKTFAEAKGEVSYAASFVSWFAEEAPRSYGDVIPSSTHGNLVMTYKQPIGVCAIITPWNFPAAMITRKIAPALGAGCAVVIKPPSETPFTCMALIELAVRAGLPGSCMQAVPTKDRNAATELVTNPIIKKVSFTGSTSVGKHLSKLAMDTMKKVSMELGGNAPFIVFEDADIDTAVDGAMACKFRCSGQTCVCANRLYVHEAVADEFTAKLVLAVNRLKLGYGLDPETTQGPLVNRGGVEKMTAHIEDAVSKGAKIETGGRKPALPGFFHEPTVLSGVTSAMAVATDETFGPLAPIFTFSTEEEVVALANNTEFGLAGYFYSKDVARVIRVSRAIECGMVGVNTGKISAAEAPFGGVKESGVGREGSKYGMAEYETIKTVTIGSVLQV
ncbi:aldehyde dehydrogenase [Limtongia smithiae]|uniref:aldehyde dehydrogenase n=1 Tax=Limtongia smithiae TaxID=1125753 RepID=UPI0034CE5B9E